MFLLEDFLEFSLNLGFLIKAFLVLFVVFYTIFSLIIFRQIQLMEKTLPLPLSPVLTFIGVIQIGVSLAFLFVVLGAF